MAAGGEEAGGINTPFSFQSPAGGLSLAEGNRKVENKGVIDALSTEVSLPGSELGEGWRAWGWRGQLIISLPEGMSSAPQSSQWCLFSLWSSPTLRGP